MSYSVKKIADLLHISKTYVSKICNEKLCIKPIVNSNRYEYTQEQFEQIKNYYDNHKVQTEKTQKDSLQDFIDYAHNCTPHANKSDTDNANAPQSDITPFLQGLYESELQHYKDENDFLKGVITSLNAQIELLHTELSVEQELNKRNLVISQTAIQYPQEKEKRQSIFAVLFKKDKPKNE